METAVSAPRQSAPLSSLSHSALTELCHTLQYDRERERLARLSAEANLATAAAAAAAARADVAALRAAVADMTQQREAEHRTFQAMEQDVVALSDAHVEATRRRVDVEAQLAALARQLDAVRKEAWEAQRDADLLRQRLDASAGASRQATDVGVLSAHTARLEERSAADGRVAAVLAETAVLRDQVRRLAADNAALRSAKADAIADGNAVAASLRKQLQAVEDGKTRLVWELRQAMDAAVAADVRAMRAEAQGERLADKVHALQCAGAVTIMPYPSGKCN